MAQFAIFWICITIIGVFETCFSLPICHFKWIECCAVEHFIIHNYNIHVGSVCVCERARMIEKWMENYIGKRVQTQKWVEWFKTLSSFNLTTLFKSIIIFSSFYFFFLSLSFSRFFVHSQILSGKFRTLSDVYMWRGLRIKSLLCHYASWLSRFSSLPAVGGRCTCI